MAFYRGVILLYLALVLVVKLDFAYSNLSCIVIEKEALFDLRRGLIHKANRLSSWKGDNCCAWDGVGCDERTGHVIKLDLSNPVSFDSERYFDDKDYFANFSHNCLGDSLSWLSQFSSLKSLDLSGIQLWKANDWLDSVNMLTSLISLNVAGCGLTTFPPISHINFTSLASLNLQWNNFDSNIPLWLSNVTSLQQLHLDHNSFDGLIPDSIEQLTSLTLLDLSSNFFSIPLPNSLCRLKNLVHLDLSGNYLNGTVPYCLENLTSLAILNLEANNFQGSIPDSICNLCSLQVLDLSLNQFHSSLPNILRDPSCCLLNSLKELYLVSSNIFGSLPSQLQMYKNLEVLHVSFNSFSGPIPFELGRLSHLRELDLSNNKFSGNVSPGIGQLSKLVKLDISNNSFTGALSEIHFEKLTELRDLSVSLNPLHLNVSPEWLPPFQLHTIQLASIIVGPRFPPWLQTQKSVKQLIMSNASISDTIPAWFENLYSQIDDLDLSHNNISGQLPKFEESRGSLRVIKLNSNKFEGPIESVPLEMYLLDLSENLLSGPLVPLVNNHTSRSLNHLILSGNHLSGEIPLSLCVTQSLVRIDLSANQFSGTIPSCLANLQNLQVLDLSNNSLSGQIPDSWVFSEELHSLHLQQNKLDGKIPSSVRNLKGLHILDLGDNELKDIIPSWIGEELQGLVYLRLHSNNFYSGIPLQLCQLKILRLLDLAKNNLSGSIPHCVNNFSAMISDDPILSSHMRFLIYFERRILESAQGMEQKYSTTLPFLLSIQLSHNNISGEIPEELMDLLILKNLNLSHNHLQGTIPEKIGNLKNLETLDLSRNELSGPIPTSLSIIYSLSHLNLSFNSLSGPIPTGKQLQTLNNESIYEGNSGLCGAPLSNSCSEEKSSNGDEPLLDSESDMQLESLWFYAGLGPGFGFGFLVVCCTLVFKRSWSNALFLFLDNLFSRRRQQ
ncbi:receptor-like protein EIX2 [Coffea eugenioides]|uniref:receptor-like protein EIX2 n=1 Tax=Coffea eugenioides TaxID=49369 RepID=UPI000F607DEF|nr:receptor-like protein EIX2 [Coffea eugenioides]